MCCNKKNVTAIRARRLAKPVATLPSGPARGQANRGYII
jgi:hypothetical protein